MFDAAIRLHPNQELAIDLAGLGKELKDIRFPVGYLHKLNLLRHLGFSCCQRRQPAIAFFLLYRFILMSLLSRAVFLFYRGMLTHPGVLMQQTQGLTFSADCKAVMNFEPLLLGLIEIAQAMVCG
ncbi:hypothetical protein C7293_23980 [filamentous cyanobacterium CCT1]|nr:hypothetical protein C7293_23980 [filamentous cyanobacterium CCT1]PSN78296.1 hypothetical protein C8B47_17615 [filamentous cyanobacterium CCP4]